MWMKLVEVVENEFKNSEFSENREKLEYLFRVQAARCNEINIFIFNLARQFPEWWRAEGGPVWTDYPTRYWDNTHVAQFGSPTNWPLPKLGSRADTQKIKRLFDAKYLAMVSAKREYERAGGNYRG